MKISPSLLSNSLISYPVDAFTAIKRDVFHGFPILNTLRREESMPNRYERAFVDVEKLGGGKMNWADN